MFNPITDECLVSVTQSWLTHNLKLKVQPQIVPVQNRGTFIWTIISKTWPPLIRSPIGLLESVTFQLHDRMLSLFVATSLKSYGHFSYLGVQIAPSHRHVEKRSFCFNKTYTGIHGSYLNGVGSSTAIVFPDILFARDSGFDTCGGGII